MSFADLLKKSKEKAAQATQATQEPQSNEQKTEETKAKPFAFGTRTQTSLEEKRKNFSFGIRKPESKIQSPTVSETTAGNDIGKLDLGINLDAEVSLNNDSKFVFDSQPDQFSDDMVAIIQHQIAVIESTLQAPSLRDNIINTLDFIKANPETKDILRPEDIGVMVQGLQNLYGVAIEKRQVNSAKSAKRNQIKSAIDDSFAGFSL